MPLTRRAALAAAAGGVGLVVADQRPSAATTPFYVNPFTLGVASGEPTPDGFVIWTRLAPRPLTSDGTGGVGTRRFTVDWQVSRRSDFATIERKGSVRTSKSGGHAVHVTLTGLEPGREYWYRFRVGKWLSSVGRAVTAPRLDAAVTALTVAQLSCANWQNGWFTVYRRAAEQQPDFLVHLGDFIYESAGQDTGPRAHVGAECVTLADYRRRYAQYRTDPDLQFAQASAPFVAVYDDHEVDNDWAANSPSTPFADFASRRRKALRAWYENHPVRTFSRPAADGSVRAYRRVFWGKLLTAHVLDTRQYRSDQVGNGAITEDPARLDPTRTMLGATQEGWLQQNLQGSTARWDLIAQQVMLTQRRVEVGGTRGWSADAWDGYVPARQRLLAATAAARNAVFLSGDSHAAWANLIQADFEIPDSPTVGVELSNTSVASGGDGFDGDGTHPFMAANPNLRFYNSLRGFHLLRFTPGELVADYRCVATVTTPGDTDWTRARFVVADGQPGLDQTLDQPSAPTSPTQRRAPRDLATATLKAEGLL